MIFLIDENVPELIVAALTRHGYAVQRVVQIGPGMADHEIAGRATKEHVIVTLDKDFGDLVYRDRLPISGVVLIRLAGVSLPRRAEMMIELVQQHGRDLLGYFTVIGHGGTRRQRLCHPDTDQDQRKP